MHGVTTALVAFLLVCVIFPKLVKNRPQYYAVLAVVCLIILLDALALAISGSQEVRGFRVFAYLATAFLQVAGIVLLILACGGLSLKDLAGDLSGAVEVIRRGGEEKEIIIPLSPEMERLRAQRQAERDEPSPERIVINDPQPPSRPAEKPEDKGQIPLE